MTNAEEPGRSDEIIDAEIVPMTVTMGVADGIVEADGEVIYQVKDMKVALSES